MNICVDDPTLENCLEINSDSYYLKPDYNCTNCTMNYIPFYVKYYQKQICQNIYEKITKKAEVDMDIFKDEESKNINNDGNCDKNFFTPDGKNCYKCDNLNVGMRGCSGECSFSLNRNKILLCESECKEEFIESSKGICEPCENINAGCDKCHYENKYPDNYYGIKRARRFQCDHCLNGYIKSSDGICLSCEDLNITNCEKCSQDSITGNYKCIQCSNHYFLNDLGNCQECFLTSEIINNKCIRCDDVNHGGIDNCYFCQKSEKNKLICKQCKNGYILSQNDNTCLPKNENLYQFDSCLELKFDENKNPICIRCKPEYSLLDGSKCTYTPTLFDSNLYYYNPYYISKSYIFWVDKENEHIIDEQVKLMPCRESKNLGNDKNPLYSCIKCFNIFDDEEYDNYYFTKYYYIYIFYDNEENKGNFPVKIIDETSKSNYCIRPNKDIENCLEANYNIKDGKGVYSCTKCMQKYELKYNQDLNI